MSDLSPELLAQHDGWLRALVRRLVDDGQADDVLQEVWGHAMRAELRDREALPAWLARVARRVAGKFRRGQQRRSAREQAVAETVDAPSLDPAELVARVEARQQVAKTVLELGEPFRSVVLLRYFEDQSPEQIARQLDVPAATVRTRLHRAHEKLRERFARERGSDWRGQLALLVAPMGALDGVVAPPASTTAVRSRAWLLLAPVAVAALVWAVAQLVPAPPPPPESAREPAKIAAAAADTAEDLEVAAANERSVAYVEQVSTPRVVDRSRVRLAGQVLDHAGVGIPELEIAYHKGWPERGGPPEAELVPLGRCDREGFFDVEAPRARGTLRIRGGFATLRSWVVTGEEPVEGVEDAMIVAVPRVQLGGVVVDERGRPLAGKRVGILVHDTVGLPVATAGTYFESPRAATETDALGSFQLRDVPAFPLGDLGAGILCQEGRTRIPTSDRHDLRIVVAPPKKRVRRSRRSRPKVVYFKIRGQVVTETGEPIVGAGVLAPDSGMTANTGEDGRFELGFNRVSDAGVAVLVTAIGCAPRSVRVWSQGERDGAAVTVRMRPLDQRARAVVGRVLDERGDPVAGVVLTLADAVQLDDGAFHPRWVERPEPHDFGPHAVSDEQGRFRIAGVLDRGYRLRVADEATRFAVTRGPFVPGEECTVRIPRPHVRKALRVRVVDLAGRAVDGAEVELSVVCVHSVVERFGTSTYTSFVGGDVTQTSDERGGCSFAEAPGGDVRIEVLKAGFAPTVIEHGVGADEVEVQLRRLVPFRVSAPGVDVQWSKLVLFDVAGNELKVRPAWRGDRYPTSYSFGVHGGHSGVAAVAETVHRAELHSIGNHSELLRSMSVVVAREGVTVLDFPQ